MIKTVRVIVTFVLLLGVSSECLAKNCTLTRKQIDVYLSRLENNLPTLEKQVNIITLSLQNDQDLDAIRQEFQRFQNYTDRPGEMTPLYAKIKPFKPNDDFILIGHQYIPLYSLKILHDLSNGGCYGTTSYDKALRNTSPEQWTRIAQITDKILKLLGPLNDTIVNKLDRKHTEVPQNWRCELSGEKLIPSASCLYSIMFNLNDSVARSKSPMRYYSNERERKRILKIMQKAETPALHLVMIKKYFEYLSKRQGETDWEHHIATIEQMISEMTDHQATTPSRESSMVRMDSDSTHN